MNFALRGWVLVTVPLAVGLTIITILTFLLFTTDKLATEQYRRYELLHTSDRVIVGLYESMRSLMLYGYYNRNQAFLDAYKRGIALSDTNLNELDKLVDAQPLTAEEARKQLQIWRSAHIAGKRYLEGAYNEVVKTNYADPQVGSTAEAKDHMQALQRQVDALLYTEIMERKRFIEVSFAGQQLGFTDEFNSNKKAIQLAIIVGALTMLVVTLAIARLYNKGIVERTRALADNSVRFASGLPLGPPLSGRDDLARVDSAFRKMSEALEGAARKERATITNAADVIASVDPKLKFTSVNPAAQKVFGYAADELIGRGVMDIALPDDIDSAYGQFKKLVNAESADAVFELRIRHKDGSVVHTSWAVDWSRAEQSYFCVAHDITERILAESLLKESEARTRLIVESLPLGLAIATEDGKLDIVNHKLEQMTGFKENDLVQKNVQDIFKTDGDQAFDLDLLLGTVRNAQRKMLRSDGTSFPVEIIVSEMFFRGEKRFLIMIADITERKELERLKSDFVAMVSHDLRTPLTTLHGSFDLLSSGIGGTLNEKGRRVIEVSTQETSRLITMINTLLDVERMESGNMEMQKEVAEIETIVSQAVNSVGYLAEKNGIKIVSDLEKIEVFADSGSLVQVMVNLLANSIKFSPSGSTITIQALETAHYVEVKIADQGRGIPAGAIASVFDRFKQVETADRTEKGGSGLGLAICKSIVEAHGGIIGVESTEGKGTTFWWRLPVDA
jgi:PAS domain S-box-containing protein